MGKWRIDWDGAVQKRGVTNTAQKDQNFPFWAISGIPCRLLFVEIGAEHRDGEMTKVRRAFVKLEPAHDAMLAKVLGHAGFRNAEVVRKKRLEVGVAAAAHARTGEAADSDAQSVTGLDVIIRCHVVISEHENTGTGGGMGRFIEFGGRTREEATKLHLEERKTRCQTRVTEAALDSRSTGVGNLLHRDARDGAAVDGARRKYFSRFRRWFNDAGECRRTGGSAGGFAGRSFAPIASTTTTATAMFFVRCCFGFSRLFGGGWIFLSGRGQRFVCDGSLFERNRGIGDGDSSRRGSWLFGGCRCSLGRGIVVRRQIAAEADDGVTSLRLPITAAKLCGSR